MKHKHRYVAPVKITRMNDAIVIIIVLMTFKYRIYSIVSRRL